MANTLTSLIPTIYDAADIVAREMTGMIPSVYLNASAARAAKDETITYPVVGATAAADIAAAATGPDPADVSVGNGSMTISKSRGVTFYWTGEEQKGLNNAGYYAQILQDQFSQAMRTLVNEVEADLAALYVAASRAYGTAGTTPFASDLSDPAQMLKILKDNGTPMSDLQLVINTAAGAKMRTLTQLTKANEAGATSLREMGVLLDIHGFKIRESAQIKNHTKGAGTGALINNASGEVAGETTLTYDTLTANTTGIKAGDVVTFAADTVNKYVVTTGGTAAGGDIVIAKPGLLVTAPDNNAITVGNSYAANLAFHRSAIHLITRAPAMPEGGDSADDVIEVTDQLSGVTFQVAMYRQRRRIAYEVGLAWGVKAVKPEFMGILLG